MKDMIYVLAIDFPPGVQYTSGVRSRAIGACAVTEFPN